MNKTLELRLERAIEVAKKAGDFALSKRTNQDFHISEKATNDFVTSVDKETEELIYNELHGFYKSDGFYGEESEESFGTGRWIVDPIDGTTNYFRGQPSWAVSIAYEIEFNKPLLGVIYSPCLNEMFYALKGYGAYRNGEKIQSSNIDNINYAINVCVPPHRLKEKYDNYMKIYNQIGLASSDIRSLGSCAIELSYIACGFIDGYYELNLGYYDFAAGKIILEEAGGKFSVLNSDKDLKNNRFDILATNGKLHSWFENIIL
jgi:myo-inositol-1(or 4)-monophosphatase